MSRHFRLRFLVIAFLAMPPLAATQAKPGPEQRTARYLQSIRRQPSLLLAFLREMPKGADLHSHLSGAIYAESWIDFAEENNLCVERTSLALTAPPCDASCGPSAGKPAVRCAYKDQVLYNSLIDAWSMRNWNPGKGSGHDHFFATFDKFGLAGQDHSGQMLAEAATRAAADQLQMVELMRTFEGAEAAELGIRVGFRENFGEFRTQLLAAGLRDLIASARRQLDSDESQMRSRLKCGGPEASPACDVQVRYLYQVLRGLAPEKVFAQILLGFELASADPRVLGLNLVMPEDWYVPMRDFELHMRMLNYLHELYPKVHISLHAGELAMGLVPPDGLSFHVRDSVERGQAERIGHGVSVMNENDPIALLKEMRDRKVLVEICLTSNDAILGVRGNDHPLAMYMKYGVPVALATDDEGVSRSDMTHEYLRAVETYDFIGYNELKRMARMSLEHSFLPGASLWKNAQDFRRADACTNTRDTPSAACKQFLDGSERARIQWRLEREFANFEKQY